MWHMFISWILDSDVILTAIHEKYRDLFVLHVALQIYCLVFVLFLIYQKDTRLTESYPPVCSQ